MGIRVRERRGVRSNTRRKMCWSLFVMAGRLLNCFTDGEGREVWNLRNGGFGGVGGNARFGWA